MNRESIISRWKMFSRYARFFDEPELPEGMAEEYDVLFKFTHADVNIPLWASVCKFPEGCLWDGTTLRIIRTYNKWGYSPKEMDGNPPDYIGQMFRFLCYLYAGALGALGAVNPGAEVIGRTADDALSEADEFISLYVQDTARSIANDILRYAENEYYKDFARGLQSDMRSLAGGAQAVDAQAPKDAAEGLCAGTDAGKGLCDGTVPEGLCCSEIYKNGFCEPIPDGEAQTILTGGRNNCGGKCSIRVTVQEDCITGLETGCGIAQPGMRACVRGRGYRRTYLSPDRLRYPLLRVGERGEGKFKRISWAEAVDVLHREITRITEKYGPGSRYFNYSTGVCGSIRPDDSMRRLMNLDGGFLGRYGTYSSACASFATPFIYGDLHSGNSIEDVLNTKLLILWGHNPVETIFAPESDYYMMQAKKNGTGIIVIDPRESDTVIALADEWIPIRPSTDAALASAMAYVIWSEGLQDQAFMDKYCIGFDEDHMPDDVPAGLSYKSYIFGDSDGVPKTPEWGERITGIPAETIRRLAIRYATTKPACLMPGLGNQRTGNGEQNVLAMAALCCLTGNVGIPGGGAAGNGPVYEEEVPRYPVGMAPYKGKISVYTWPDAIDRGHEMTAKDGVQGMDKLDSDIKLLFNLAGNCLINQHSDINGTAELLRDDSKLEFIVGSDVFMTASAKFFDLLLPATSFLEENDISAPWRQGHYLLCNNKVKEPLFGCRSEYDWIEELAEKMGLHDEWTLGRSCRDEWLVDLYNEVRGRHPEMPSYEKFRADGGCTYENAEPYIAFRDQILDPEHHIFKTPSGKIEIFSKRLYDMGMPDVIPAVPKYVPCPEGHEDALSEKYPLQLIGWHTRRRCHSIHDNNPIMEEVEPQRLWMHPDDARERGIESGDLVEIYNDRGIIRMPVTVTDRIIRGVCAIPQGAWYKPDKNGVDTRGSINVLTAYAPTPLAKGNPQHTNLVEVRAYK